MRFLSVAVDHLDLEACLTGVAIAALFQHRFALMFLTREVEVHGVEFARSYSGGSLILRRNRRDLIGKNWVSQPIKLKSPLRTTLFTGCPGWYKRQTDNGLCMAQKPCGRRSWKNFESLGFGYPCAGCEQRQLRHHISS